MRERRKIAETLCAEGLLPETNRIRVLEFYGALSTASFFQSNLKTMKREKII